VLAVVAALHLGTACAQEVSGPAPADLPKDMKPIYNNPDRISEDFKAHGITDTETGLIQFLEKGIDVSGKLPERPLEKSQLIIDAMARLANMRSQAAADIISRIARFDGTVGAFKLVEYDVSKSSPQAKSDFRVRAYRLIQYNAVNALGLIGSSQDCELVRAILKQDQTPGAQIQYSLSLACMGDASGMPYLLNLINQKNRRESAAAAKVFYYITGQDFGYTKNTPVRARAALAAKYIQWWQQNGQNFKLDANAVRERRLAPENSRAFPARSTRDLLKLAANYFDFNNTLGSADARKQIGAAGKTLNSDFKRIATDPMEDLDVRMEAMNWYFEANRSDPLDILKGLRKDENPEISDKANTLIEQIAEEEALRRPIRQ